MINLEQYRTEVSRFCDNQPIRRLGLFGSSLTDDFDAQSDIDVLVTFEKSADIDQFDVYFEVKEGLEDIFKRSVDLVVDKPFRNPYFQKVVDRTRQTIYER